MSIKLTQFQIRNLHGYKSVNIEISENKLILVGENGTGKTTIINLIYYFLSGQWSRMKDIAFGEINATVNGVEFHLTKEQLIETKREDNEFHHYVRYIQRNLRHGLSSSDIEHIFLDITSMYEKGFNDQDFLTLLTRRYDLPTSVIREMIDISRHQALPLFKFSDDSVAQQRKALKDLVTEQILYLPTYRRIEQELGFIFPQSEINDVLKRINRKRDIGGKHIELIEFGMKDVDVRINEKMEELKNKIHSELSVLTGSYLGEVVGGKYQTVSVENIQDLESDTIESMLGKIGDDILPHQQKEALKRILIEIKTSGKIKDVEQKVIAHFLLKLFEVHKTQASNEKNINEFVNVCNKYLVEKSLVYDNSEFKIEILIDEHKMPKIKSSKKKEPQVEDEFISMKELSSGEKQIVSLFSHLYLSSNEDFFVLIDEPELSLSVMWQKDFLMDIIKSGYCDGLIAVTHSPFIFENELDRFTRSINEFVN